MTARTTAEIVADLREWDDPEDQVHAEACDRLAELDGAYETQGADYLVALNHLRAIDALRPPCPTCGGSRTTEPYFAGSTLGYVSHVCPDCVDGKVSIEQLVARWNAVQSLSPNTRIVAVFDAERSVLP